MTNSKNISLLIVLFVTIIIIGFSIFIVVCKTNEKEANRLYQKNVNYLKSNEFYLSGTVLSVTHLNVNKYMFHVKLDTLNIEKQEVERDFFSGIRYIQTQEAFIYACMDYYDWRNPNENLLPEQIIMDTKRNEIIYKRQNIILGKNNISIDGTISMQKFRRLIDIYLKDDNWVKF
ncbi:MAG: hypothetical protein LBR81_04210 [Prevotellaceae bacterium]|jgi:hypothetical protein|nr:hypothetical protein [Prevotellaceae bacterium]